MSDYLWIHDWRVVQPPQDDPSHPLSVPQDVAEALYISREFLGVTDQIGGSVVTAPKEFPLFCAGRQNAPKSLLHRVVWVLTNNYSFVLV